MAKECDVLIIGGGITGAGIFRDCCLRGLKTILIDKGKFGCQTTVASTGSIHGGSRYLLYDPKLTEEACREAGILAKIAPHLLETKEFIFPIFPNEGNSIEKFEALFELYDKCQKMKLSAPHKRLGKKEALALEPNLSPNLVGALVVEEYIANPAALALANIFDGEFRGGEAREFAELAGLSPKNGGVAAEIKTKEGSFSVSAKIVVNAAGPWAPKIAKMADLNSVRIRPAKGIHLSVAPSPVSLSVICQAIDGRYLMLVSHNGILRVGTTDDDFYGDLDKLEITKDEAGYLMEAAARAIPAVKDAKIIGGSAGVRPTVYCWGQNEDNLSREFQIIDDFDSAKMISVIGGKMTIYRLMAEKATDKIREKIGSASGAKHFCLTAGNLLPFVGKRHYGWEKNKFFVPGGFGNMSEDDFVPRKDYFWRKLKAKINLAKAFVFHQARKLFESLGEYYEE